MWKCERCGASVPRDCRCGKDDATPPATPEPPQITNYLRHRADCAINPFADAGFPVPYDPASHANGLCNCGLIALMSQPPAVSGDVERLLAQFAEAQQQRDQMREALARVRAHTAWTIPADGEVVRLLAGLLGSIERIAEAALAKESGRWRSRSVISGSTGA